MNVKTYTAKPRSNFSNKDAERIGRFLDRKFGDSPRTPAEVVAVAKPLRSPIHGDFEWDDHAAGNAYRIGQAQYMLRSIEVIFTNGIERAPTRAYHHVIVESTSKEDSYAAYVPARIVWETPDYSTQVIAQAKRELVSWADRHRQYEELAHVMPRVDEIIEEIAA